jgi:hypothetical protein
MRKTLTLLGVLALVLAIAAGATAAGEIVLKPNSVDGRVVKDRSLHFVDLSAGGEQMIRDGWRYAMGIAKVPEANLDPALAAKINAPVTEARLDPALAAKINRPTPTTLAAKTGFLAGYENASAADLRFSRSVEFPLPAPKIIGSDDVVVVTAGATSATCPGSYVDPRATAGKICVYLAGTADGLENAKAFNVRPVGTLGFELAWRTQAAGESHLLATYAYQAPAV